MLEVLSMVPGVLWPAIPNGRAAQMLALQFQMEQSQWLPPEELRRIQIRQLGALLRHAYASVPFYRRRLDEAGLPLTAIRDEQDWRRIPLLTRRDIQMSTNDMRAGQFKEHGPITTGQTSGSSGQPVVTAGTTVTRLFQNCAMLRHHLWHRRDLSLTLAMIRSFKHIDGEQPQEATTKDWGFGTLDVVRTGPAHALDIHTTIEEQAEFLLKHDPHYLLTHPSVILELARYFERSERKLTRLKEVRSFGEVLEPHVRAACRRTWGVKIVDSYSSQELGDIALQCPDHEHYHVHAEKNLVEVLREDGTWCEPGETGRLVITSLHNFAMPLIRYDIGDFGEVGGACSCGRGLPVLNRILGRQRNMFLLPDGRRVWPALELSSEEITDLPPIQQFQLIQRSLDLVELLIVTPRLLTDSEVAYLQRAVDRAIGHRFNLKITYVDSIARGRTGKYEDTRCDIDAAS